MHPKAEAAVHDARAVLALVTSLRDSVVELHRLNVVTSHVLEAVEAMHAEALKACHLVTTAGAMLKHAERPERVRPW